LSAPDWVPRDQIIAEAFPGQTVPNSPGRRKISCVLPGCAHASGTDKNPSLSFDPESGSFRCMVSKRSGSTYKDLVTELWGSTRWDQIVSRHHPKALPEIQASPTEQLLKIWRGLRPEREWTDCYGIDHELSAKYLRSGRRYSSDPWSMSAVGLFVGEELRSIKFRLPAGSTWGDGKADKYRVPKGGRTKGVIFLLDRADPGATLVFCAGEKDALVAASYLDPKTWAPISGCVGEGAIPNGAAGAVEGRCVVIAYDGDGPGHEGAVKLGRFLDRSAQSVRYAQLPTECPPLSKRPGYDVADVVNTYGGARLCEILFDAAEEPPASWAPPENTPFFSAAGPEKDPPPLDQPSGSGQLPRSPPAGARTPGNQAGGETRQSSPTNLG